MSVFPTLRSLTLFAAVSLSLVGCKQGEGEVCDVDSDCEMGFSCCGGGEPSVRGICQPEGDDCPDRERDGGPVRDSGPEPDGGPGPSDAGTDSGTAADAGTDGGNAVDGGPDAATVEDAGSDAGDAA